MSEIVCVRTYQSPCVLLCEMLVCGVMTLNLNVYTWCDADRSGECLCIGVLSRIRLCAPIFISDSSETLFSGHLRPHDHTPRFHVPSSVLKWGGIIARRWIATSAPVRGQKVTCV